MSDTKNLDDLLAQLNQGTLAAELVGACREYPNSEDRAGALRNVLQGRLDALLADGGRDGEVPSA